MSWLANIRQLSPWKKYALGYVGVAFPVGAVYGFAGQADAPLEFLIMGYERFGHNSNTCPPHLTVDRVGLAMVGGAVAASTVVLSPFMAMQFARGVETEWRRSSQRVLD